MSAVEGVSDDQAILKAEERHRKATLLEKTVRQSEVEESQSDGWAVVRVNRATTRMRKEKNIDVAFEDRVWRVFRGLGFSALSLRPCTVEVEGAYRKKVDVIARDEENLFIVECKASDRERPVPAREPLEYFSGHYAGFLAAVRRQWGRTCGRLTAVVAIGSMEARPVDEEYCDSLHRTRRNILLWSEADLRYIERLVEEVGPLARYQLYSVIFAGKEVRALSVAYPALRGRLGDHACYSLLMPASQLLKYAYVHHRQLAGIRMRAAAQAYQRMLNSSKLRQVRRYLDDGYGYFPNAVIVNFSERIRWDGHREDSGVAVGTVTLPGRYGCAWVIDGQHRLYGAAGAERDPFLPVLAFDGLSQGEQAQLFVDINKQQTSVKANLLWDLYSDIYRDAEERKDRVLFQVAETAKLLAQEGPLAGHVRVESLPATHNGQITLETVCTGLWKYSGIWKNYVSAVMGDEDDDGRIVSHAADILSDYFTSLEELWPEDWANGDRGVLLSNNGFGVFVTLLGDTLGHVILAGDEALLRRTNAQRLRAIIKDRYLTPAVQFLREEEARGEKGAYQEIIKANSRGAQRFCVDILRDCIAESVASFRPPHARTRKEDQAYDQQFEKLQAERSRAITEIGPTVEPFLRTYVQQEIESHYGNAWWRRGLPHGVRERLRERWRGEFQDRPQMRRKIGRAHV